MVYVYRKVKPVVVSYFHHNQTLKGYRGTLEQFVESFQRNSVICSPYHEHVLEYHAVSHLDNILLLNYEDMKKDLRAVVLKVCSFFGKAYTDLQVNELCQHLSFDNMQSNPSVNGQVWVTNALAKFHRLHEINHENRKFIRKGEIDGWKDDLSEEMANKIDDWTRDKVDPENLKLFI